MLRSPLSCLFVALLAFAAALSPSRARAADEVFATADGAIRGFDPVAYHTRAQPVPGKASITHQWQGATWRFASHRNRALFVADPGRYAPRYGGYCAYGTSQGYKVSTDPEAFAIVDGRLYLNHNQRVQLIWNVDRPGNIARADGKWDALQGTPYSRDE